MKNFLAITAATVLISACGVSAAETNDRAYFSVDEKSITIEEIKDDGALPSAAVQPDARIELPSVTPAKDGGLAVAEGLVNLAEKIWAIIEKNQPVVNVTTKYANAVPAGTTHWSQLQGWSRPASKRYTFNVRNVYGMDVVKVIYQVSWTYGGNVGGKGKFLTGVTVEPISVTTAWGFKVDLVSEVPDLTIANVGTYEDPVAAMQVQLKWTVHSVINDVTSKAIYYVEGNGFMQEIGSPFRNSQQASADKKADAITLRLSDVAFN